MISLKCVLVLVACLTLCASVKFPDGFKLCKKDDSFNKCFMEAIILDDGFLKTSGFGDLPPSQPVNGGQIKLKVGGESVGVFLNTVLNDVKFTYVLANTSNSDVDWDKGTFQLDGFFKELKGKATHNTTGRFVVANVGGAGRFETTFYDALVGLKADMANIEKDGTTYWQLANLGFKIKKVRKIAVDFDLVPNKDVNNAIIRAINDNYEAVLLPLLPTLEKQMAPKIQDHINGILIHVPADELFNST